MRPLVAKPFFFAMVLLAALAPLSPAYGGVPVPAPPPIPTPPLTVNSIMSG
jgi:hypothetical protein